MSRSSSGLIALSNPASSAAETFRSLSTVLQHQHAKSQHPGCKVYLVTSPLEGEGKTTTISNLAVTYAQAGKKVLLIDCNLRNPRIADWFNLTPQSGVLDYLLHHVEPLSLLHGTPIDSLKIIQAGRLRFDPANAGHLDQLEELISALRSQFDIILVDTPPVLRYADAQMIADKCDGVILVVKYGQTKGELVRKARQSLEQVGATVLGVVMNQAK
ncbi:MAG: tyrosine protein kinase [Paenibacillaceae bacterium]|jgi:capsular exopolysaccharide synthesis family protein|nr:tyrosine protein kinase [Paenibacillaceae bacterium]